MTVKYKGYIAILDGAKELTIIKDSKVILHTFHRTAETLTQIHELIDVLDGETF